MGPAVTSIRDVKKTAHSENDHLNRVGQLIEHVGYDAREHALGKILRIPASIQTTQGLLRAKVPGVASKRPNLTCSCTTRMFRSDLDCVRRCTSAHAVNEEGPFSFEALQMPWSTLRCSLSTKRTNAQQRTYSAKTVTLQSVRSSKHGCRAYSLEVRIGRQHLSYSCSRRCQAAHQ